MLSGTVRLGGGQQVTQYRVVVFSADPELRGLTRRQRVSAIDVDGRFRVQGLPSGRYLMAVATGLSLDDLFRDEFFQQLVPAAIEVTLSAGEHRVQDVITR